MPRKRISKPKWGWRNTADVQLQFSFTPDQRDRIVAAIGKKGGEYINVFVRDLEIDVSLLKAARNQGETEPNNKEVLAALEHSIKTVTDLQFILDSLDSNSLSFLRRGLRSSLPDPPCVYELFDRMRPDLCRLEFGLKAAIEIVKPITQKKSAPRKLAYYFLTRSIAAAFENTLGIKPTKYREGAYSTVLKICLEAAGIPTTSVFPLLKQGVESVLVSDAEIERVLLPNEVAASRDE